MTLGFAFYLNNYLRPILPEEWVVFITGCITYLVTLIYGGMFYLKGLSRLRGRFIFFLVAYYFVTIGLFFTIFYFKLIPLPSQLRIYVLPVFALSMGAVICFDIIARKR